MFTSTFVIHSCIATKRYSVFHVFLFISLLNPNSNRAFDRAFKSDNIYLLTGKKPFSYATTFTLNCINSSSTPDRKIDRRYKETATPSSEAGQTQLSNAIYPMSLRRFYAEKLTSGESFDARLQCCAPFLFHRPRGVKSATPTHYNVLRAPPPIGGEGLRCTCRFCSKLRTSVFR